MVHVSKSTGHFFDSLDLGVEYFTGIIETILFHSLPAAPSGTHSTLPSVVPLL